jgi:hypothetical protein
MQLRLKWYMINHAYNYFYLFQKIGTGYTKGEGLKRSLQSTEPFDVPMTDSVRGNLLAPSLFHLVGIQKFYSVPS